MFRLGRQARVAAKRVYRKKSPFVYKSYSKKAKHRWVARRRRREKHFRLRGLIAVLISAFFLAGLFWSIVSKGYTAFVKTQILLPVEFAADILDPQGIAEAALLAKGDYARILRDSLQEVFPEVTSRGQMRELQALVSREAPHKLRNRVLEDPSIIGTAQDIWLPVSSDVDIVFKSRLYQLPEKRGRISEEQAAWITELAAQGRLRLIFNTTFFKSGDSREPEQAGVSGAIVGSFFTILVCIALAFPLGVATAMYLEEFAPQNWFTDLIEININNLAAVPSIIFGLLGLSVYLNFFDLPRSSSLVGGLVLALLVLPVIVIATRNAIRAVPKSIRFAAAALGATPTQVAFHHTFIYALPGIMTGVILSIARALGETAPLLMIGMVAFVADIPGSLTDPATTLPVQVFLWANSPETGFVEKTAAAIMVLLAFLVLVNALAIYVRRRFEIQW
ncbi:MAG: phosphate ABC transporter permease PstA [Alphaproteobacteria bacterium]|nr:phosphate ABC transporter permease PstA [Alphaproteobacteria bacterium]